VGHQTTTTRVGDESRGDGVMIILGWIAAFFLVALAVALLARSEHETFLESCKNSIRALFFITSFVGLLGGVGFFISAVVIGIAEYEHTDKPTTLVCNNVTVAESADGFVYNSKGGAYEDSRNNLTYTPRQGEVCKELLKESK
jgi:hypothetical protein